MESSKLEVEILPNCNFFILYFDPLIIGCKLKYLRFEDSIDSWEAIGKLSIEQIIKC